VDCPSFSSPNKGTEPNRKTNKILISVIDKKNNRKTYMIKAERRNVRSKGDQSQLKGSENIGGHVRWQRNNISWTDLTSKCDQLVIVPTEKRETE